LVSVWSIALIRAGQNEGVDCRFGSHGARLLATSLVITHLMRACRRAEQELAGLYRERELARARAPEHDPGMPLQ